MLNENGAETSEDRVGPDNLKTGINLGETADETFQVKQPQIDRDCVAQEKKVALVSRRQPMAKTVALLAFADKMTSARGEETVGTVNDDSMKVAVVVAVIGLTVATFWIGRCYDHYDRKMVWKMTCSMLRKAQAMYAIMLMESCDKTLVDMLSRGNTSKNKGARRSANGASIGSSTNDSVMTEDTADRQAEREEADELAASIAELAEGISGLATAQENLLGPVRPAEHEYRCPRNPSLPVTPNPMDYGINDYESDDDGSTPYLWVPQNDRCDRPDLRGLCARRSAVSRGVQAGYSGLMAQARDCSRATSFGINTLMVIDTLSGVEVIGPTTRFSAEFKKWGGTFVRQGGRYTFPGGDVELMSTRLMALLRGDPDAPEMQKARIIDVPGHPEEGFRRMFLKYDVDRDGYISCGDIKIMMWNGRDPAVTDELVETVFDRYDVDGDGRLSYPEFLRVYEGATLDEENRGPGDSSSSGERNRDGGSEVDKWRRFTCRNCGSEWNTPDSIRMDRDWVGPATWFEGAWYCQICIDGVRPSSDDI